ncbi:hypothetical protein [Rhizomicrobium electricum]|uniref:Uncharacterized protein n=1 Tax=Rhizomicrobium electricum TaxID=480070 RepID=A0ABN1EUP3_9PROT|nr:hypothetical protein [Rhizomicrobium electricum]NIJ49615.1 hypothetical protein [Rhizomicrobium electricum]
MTAFALAETQVPSLLIEAMRRRARRRPAGTRGFDDERRRIGEGVPPPPVHTAHNNYVAESAAGSAKTAPAGRPNKVGAPFGNRNAFKPERAEAKALLKNVRLHIARMKAAIAAAEAVLAARRTLPPRRITCLIYE